MTFYYFGEEEVTCEEAHKIGNGQIRSSEKKISFKKVKKETKK